VGTLIDRRGAARHILRADEYDRRSGKPLGANLGEISRHDARRCAARARHHVSQRSRSLDLSINRSAHGIGEIGITGVAPAIASAVYHATGVRVRNLPIKIVDLIAPKGQS